MYDNLKKVSIWTDGSAIGSSRNPGPGGWAWMRHHRDSEGGLIETLGSGRTTENTDNLRMELTAVCEALEAVPFPAHVNVNSDSSHIIKCMQAKWPYRWRDATPEWTALSGEPISNRDLWERILKEDKRHYRITWQKVRGHGNNEGNVRVDGMAYNQAQIAKDLRIGRIGRR